MLKICAEEKVQSLFRGRKGRRSIVELQRASMDGASAEAPASAGAADAAAASAAMSASSAATKAPSAPGMSRSRVDAFVADKRAVVLLVQSAICGDNYLFFGAENMRRREGAVDLPRASWAEGTKGACKRAASDSHRRRDETAGVRTTGTGDRGS